jgi:hypothetical protein
VEDKFAREVYFPLGNFVERINLRVVDNRRIETAVNGFFQKDAVKHAARIRIQSEGDVADA